MQRVLGGCALPWSWSAAPPPIDPAVNDRILAHARRLGLAHGAIRRTRVGLRPSRATVRLERDPLVPRLLHCYGHGGAGYTLAHGCALDLAALVATTPYAA